MYQQKQKSKNNKFIQFLSRSWKLQSTVLSTVLATLIIAIILLCISVAYFITNTNISQYHINNYENTNECSNQNKCTINFVLAKQFKAPVYLLYGLENFYQNNRKYSLSKNNYQLAGNLIEPAESNRYCSPVVYNSNLYVNVSWGGVPLDPNAVANPCGMLAKSFFNDTYQLFGPGNVQISISQNGIAWPRQIGKKMKRSINSSSIQWTDPQSQRFDVWMRNAGLPNFMKPWGIISQNLAAGNYSIQISNNYNMNEYNGKKNIILTTVGPFGGKNYFKPITLMIFSGIFFYVAGVFMYRYKSTNGTFGPKKQI